MNDQIAVYSGDCRLCDCGQETGITAWDGSELKTGDIVIPVVDDRPCGLTVVVSDQWQSFSDGTHVEKHGKPDYFIMGIKNVQLTDDGEWKVYRVKKSEDAIDGERWPDYKFSYRATPPTGSDHE